MPKKPSTTPRIQHKKALHRFEVLEKLACGIMLQGTEVKSLREGQGSLDESYARIDKGEIWLIGFHIGPYSHGRTQAHVPKRSRKLLLQRREIKKWEPKVIQRGLTLVPLEVFFNERGLAKVVLALVKGKTHRDKRESLKKADHKREMEQAMRRGR